METRQAVVCRITPDVGPEGEPKAGVPFLALVLLDGLDGDPIGALDLKTGAQVNPLRIYNYQKHFEQGCFALPL